MKKALPPIVVVAAALALAPWARAQPHESDLRKAPQAAPATDLSPNDAQILELARECAKQITAVMEGWIAKNEISEDRLFSFLYYPIEGTSPPKFHTDYDQLADRDFAAIQESYLAKSQSIVFVVTVDLNGYLPTHNSRFSQPLTGNPAVDLVNNRTKNIFDDRTGLAAARSTAPYLLQRYNRDTGEKMVDLSVPIMIRGKHWGALRIGYRQVDAP